MKAYCVVEVYLHIFITVALAGDATESVRILWGRGKSAASWS
jgi:hypothetical protein